MCIYEKKIDSNTVHPVGDLDFRFGKINPRKILFVLFLFCSATLYWKQKTKKPKTIKKKKRHSYLFPSETQEFS